MSLIGRITALINAIASDIKNKQNKISFGTSQPSGGNDVDIYLQYND